MKRYLDKIETVDNQDELGLPIVVSLKSESGGCAFGISRTTFVIAFFQKNKKDSDGKQQSLEETTKRVRARVKWLQEKDGQKGYDKKDRSTG